MTTLGIVIGEFHKDLANRMLGSAREASGSATLEVIWVPGTYEAPLVVKRLLSRSDIDGVVVIGYIEKGETQHGEHMGLVTSHLFKQLELEYSKPVGMGIIGPGATREQAEKRVSYAGKAVRATLKMCEMNK